MVLPGALAPAGGLRSGKAPGTDPYSQTHDGGDVQRDGQQTWYSTVLASQEQAVGSAPPSVASFSQCHFDGLCFSS